MTYLEFVHYSLNWYFHLTPTGLKGEHAHAMISQLRRKMTVEEERYLVLEMKGVADKLQPHYRLSFYFSTLHLLKDDQSNSPLNMFKLLPVVWDGIMLFYGFQKSAEFFNFFLEPFAEFEKILDNANVTPIEEIKNKFKALEPKVEALRQKAWRERPDLFPAEYLP